MKIYVLSLLCFGLLISCQPTPDPTDKELYFLMRETIKEKENRNAALSLSIHEDDGKKIGHLLGDRKEPFVLVFKFSDRDCDVCIDSVMSLLQREDWGRTMPINVLNYALGVKSIYAFKPWYNSIANVSFTVVNLFSDSINNLKVDQYRRPYFFLVNIRSNTISHIFFPDKEKIGTTNKYLQIIMERFFNKG